MIPSRTLPRAERLRTLGAIRRLFESGESGFVYPFRYVWFAEADDRMSAEVLFPFPRSSTSAPTGATFSAAGRRRLPGSTRGCCSRRAERRLPWTWR